MNPKRTPWYRTKWGLPIAVILSPLRLVWKQSRRNRIPRIIANGIAALAVFIVLVLIFHHIFKSSPPSNTTTTTTTGTTSSGSTTALQGYGATLSEWNANHTPDTSLAANSTYDPTGGLGNGYNDKYVAVLWIDGRALGYQIGFANNTPIAAAQTEVMQEFPGDATILWQQQNNSDPENICYQMEVHSSILAEALNTSGDVFVEFQTISTSDTTSSAGYYANNVNNATLRNSDYKTAKAVGGC